MIQIPKGIINGSISIYKCQQQTTKTTIFLSPTLQSLFDLKNK